MSDPGFRPLERDELAEPRPARPRLRHLFDPVRGWFRCLERGCNQLLSQRVLRLIPGIDSPYTFQLDRWLTVSEAEVRISGFPGPFEGTRVLLITDIHTGPFLSPRCLKRTFRRLASLDADLILLGGDLTTSRIGEFLPSMEAFASLEAPLGVFAVLGNHDHYTEDPELLRNMVEKTGVRLLHNRAMVFERDESRLTLAGIDDLNAGAPDLDAALASGEALRRGARPSVGGQPSGSKEPIILLSHNPDVFFDAARRGVSLVLSGHTHGGQIRIPGLPVLVRMSRYRLDEGRYCVNGAELVVSRGLGVVGLPLRVACPPEVVLLKLRRA